jgi:hypothetical protein
VRTRERKDKIECTAFVDRRLYCHSHLLFVCHIGHYVAIVRRARQSFTGLAEIDADNVCTFCPKPIDEDSADSRSGTGDER